MKNLTIAFLAVASLTSFGCKKKGGAGEAMAKMSEFKDQMCKCTDKPCADKVQADMNKWSADNAKNAGDKPEKPSDEDMKKMQDVGTKYGECMAKAMSAGASVDPGSAAAPAAPAAPAAMGAKSACVDGAWKDPSNTYCVKVPEGFTPPKTASAKSDGRLRDKFDTEGNNTFTITVYDNTMQFDDAKKTILGEGNGSKIVDKGDFEGGGFFVKHRNDTEKEGGFASVVKSGNNVIICESVFADDAPGKPDDACKTLRAL